MDMLKMWEKEMRDCNFWLRLAQKCYCDSAMMVMATMPALTDSQHHNWPSVQTAAWQSLLRASQSCSISSPSPRLVPLCTESPASGSSHPTWQKQTKTGTMLRNKHATSTQCGFQQCIVLALKQCSSWKRNSSISKETEIGFAASCTKFYQVH